MQVGGHWHGSTARTGSDHRPKAIGQRCTRIDLRLNPHAHNLGDKRWRYRGQRNAVYGGGQIMGAG